MARVIISSGHTSSNPGTVVGDLREVDLARSISKKITPYLRHNGIITLSVPYDLEPDRRINWINSTGYKAALEDVFVEIHLNEGGKSGVEAWYIDGENDKSKKLAEAITQKVSEKTKLPVVGVSEQAKHPFGGIFILQEVKPIAVLLECAYIDSKEDERFLTNEQNMDFLAKSIAMGIMDFLNISFNDPKPEINSVQEKEEKKDQPSTPVMSPVITRQETPVTKPAPEPVKPAPMNAPKPFAGNSLPNMSNNRSNFPAPSANNFKANAPAFSDDDDFGMNDGFSAGGFSGYGGGNAGGANNFSGLGGGVKMSREERKEMIKKFYKKAFGKQAEKNDLNYFLNIGISEDQFLKRILESQDHQNIVDKAGKYDELKEKFDKIDAENEQNKRQLADQRQILENLNSLILKKNFALAEMQKRIQLLTERLEQMQSSSKGGGQKLNYKPKKSDRIFELLSDLLS
jgi:uncharacterized coiled-coil protein SlyX